jgi:hypothetical protein
VNCNFYDDPESIHIAVTIYKSTCNAFVPIASPILRRVVHLYCEGASPGSLSTDTTSRIIPASAHGHPALNVGEEPKKGSTMK